jgi:DNA (cytosine-5)-methyltransferase 1
MTLKMLDLFAGIGGFAYAAERLVGGFETTQFVEWNAPCQRVLAKHWLNVPIHADIKDFHGTPRQFDVITGGFPCQDISVAGKQLGLEGERSSMFYEVMRLLGEIRPRFLLLENVGNLLSHKNGETFQEVLFQIAKAGYNVEWSAIPASDVGACHRRVRTWIVAYSNHSGLEGWVVKELSECSSQQPAWTKGTPYLQPDWRRFVSEPVLRRGDDGLRGRVDRLKQLGNAVVPHVAAVPLERIKQLSEQGF